MRNKNDFTFKMIVGFFVLNFLSCYAIRAPQDYSDLPKLTYCSEKYPALDCCSGRQDECSAPLLTTTCYCDDYCERPDGDDCCPDYWSHCKGITFTTISPPGPVVEGCKYNEDYYYIGHIIHDNCNECKCTNMGNKTEMLCEKNRCLVEDDILTDINLAGSRLGWRAENVSKFWGRTLDEGIKLRLGTLNPSRSVGKLHPVRRIYDPDRLPRSFDSRTKWPKRISGIKDQGWCGASWAFSTADVASDRFAVLSEGNETVQLSVQHLLSCNDRGQQGCQGGYLDKAWVFVNRFGLVEEDCYPWTGKNGKCKLRKRTTLREANCRVPTNPPRHKPYVVGPSYRLGNETDIMQEILISGPVQATMKVYQDFFVYKSGVYKHSPLTESQPTGHHSVRIIGWGEELSMYGPPVKYWVVANSWGSDWGENGFFRILRGVNECAIEEFVIAVWAETPEVIRNYK